MDFRYKIGDGNKKSPVPRIRTKRKRTPRYHPKFSAQSQHSDGRVTVPDRIGLVAEAFARSAPKGNAKLDGHAPITAKGHSLK